MPCEVHCPWWVGSWMLCLIKCVQPLHVMVVHIAGQFRPWDIPVWYLHVGPNCLLYTSVLVPKCPDSLDPSHPYPSVSLLNFGSWMRCPSCPLLQPVVRLIKVNISSLLTVVYRWSLMNTRHFTSAAGPLLFRATLPLRYICCIFRHCNRTNRNDFVIARGELIRSFTSLRKVFSVVLVK